MLNRYFKREYTKQEPDFARFGICPHHTCYLPWGIEFRFYASDVEMIVLDVYREKTFRLYARHNYNPNIHNHPPTKETDKNTLFWRFNTNDEFMYMLLELGHRIASDYTIERSISYLTTTFKQKLCLS